MQISEMQSPAVVEPSRESQSRHGVKATLLSEGPTGLAGFRRKKRAHPAPRNVQTEQLGQIGGELVQVNAVHVTVAHVQGVQVREGRHPTQVFDAGHAVQVELSQAAQSRQLLHICTSWA